MACARRRPGRLRRPAPAGPVGPVAGGGAGSPRRARGKLGITLSSPRPLLLRPRPCPAPCPASLRARRRPPPHRGPDPGCLTARGPRQRSQCASLCEVRVVILTCVAALTPPDAFFHQPRNSAVETWPSAPGGKAAKGRPRPCKHRHRTSICCEKMPGPRARLATADTIVHVRVHDPLFT